VKLLFLLLLISNFASSQNPLNGTILDNNNNFLTNANIQWINSLVGTTSDLNGKFSISQNNVKDRRLIISYIGFNTDTVNVKINENELIVKLESANNLNTVILEEEIEGIYIDKQKAIKTEVITQDELTKAACCELAGCFETQLSVEPKTTNIITNTKEISVLGLSGVYNQILINGFPILNGLNYTYGISAIPGTLIDNIFISQGLASVIQGAESITGQINIQLKEKSTSETLFFNLYMNSFLAKQANIDYNFKIKNWKSILSFHTTQPGAKIDKNNDNFLDLPLTTKYSLYNKWINGNKDNIGLYSIITLRYLNEKRIGGQENYNESYFGSDSVYGQLIEFSQPEIHLKSTYKFNDNNNLILKSAFTHHDQESYFGTTKYNANQQNYYIDISNKLNWRNHLLVYGLNYNRTYLKENIQLNDEFDRSFGGKYNKKEIISGLYIENTFNWNDSKLQIISGGRIDNHNSLGLFFTPRFLIKYNITENTTVRASVGTGWKTVNIFSENIKLFGTNRNIIISDDLEEEKAINFGFNFLHAMYLENIEMQFIFDAYKTNFYNQIHPHYHSDNIIDIHNLKNNSFGNSLQGEFAIELFEKFGCKFAYNYLDIYHFEDNIRYRLPFTSKHHALSTVSYKPSNEKWHIDCNFHWFGKKKLMFTSNNTNPNNIRPLYSDPYSMFSAQFTKKFEKTDIYIGAENLFNFKQENPIISWEDPFNEEFNIANIWGPTKGREIYLGLRFRL
tara:strand:- start:120 stop:2330 length:2211 start_codon:yes stop_codon:yes gene_type:complete